MLDGFENDVADKVNGGSYFSGNDFSLSKMTTPIRNDIKGFQSNVPYGTYTGSNGIDEIGYLRIINGEAASNKIFTLWNGTAMINTTLSDPELITSMTELNNVSAGMQFPPNIQDGDQLRLYD